jgi:hypothetical protein
MIDLKSTIALERLQGLDSFSLISFLFVFDDYI